MVETFRCDDEKPARCRIQRKSNKTIKFQRVQLHLRLCWGPLILPSGPETEFLRGGERPGSSSNLARDGLVALLSRAWCGYRLLPLILAYTEPTDWMYGLGWPPVVSVVPSFKGAPNAGMNCRVFPVKGMLTPRLPYSHMLKRTPCFSCSACGRSNFVRTVGESTTPFSLIC